MTLKRVVTGLLVTMFAALAGCGTRGAHRDLDASVDPGLGPITYVVTSVTHDGRPRPLVPGTEIRLGFAGSRVTLTAGCNTMSGRYQLEESRLTLEPLASTEMGCDRRRTAQDSWLAGLFERPVQLSTGAEPTIVAGRTVLAMAESDQLHPAKPLLGTRWELDTVIEGAAASSLPSEQKASMRIVGRALQARNGCNTGDGTALVRNGMVGFSDVVLTVRPCPSGDQAVLEFGAMLAGSGSYEIVGDRLTITRGGRGLGFTAAD